MGETSRWLARRCPIHGPQQQWKQLVNFLRHRLALTMGILKGSTRAKKEDLVAMFEEMRREYLENCSIQPSELSPQFSEINPPMSESSCTTCEGVWKNFENEAKNLQKSLNIFCKELQKRPHTGISCLRNMEHMREITRRLDSVKAVLEMNHSQLEDSPADHLNQGEIGMTFSQS